MATEEKLPDSLSGFAPSEREKELHQFLFDKADTDGLGVLTGDKAVPFFAFSSLPPATLGEIWQLADPENSGFLTPARFGVACRLIGHAQQHKNEPLNEAWIGQSPAHPPKFQGISPPARLLEQQQQQPEQTPATTTITPADRAKYARLFANAGPTNNGLLDGDKARDIFIKSGLPFETLSKIWALSDTHSRGALDVADFCVGMQLIQGSMNGTMPSLPAVLSPQLYASALGTAVPTTSPSSPARHPPPVPPHRQGSHPLAAPRPFATPFPQPQQSAPTQGLSWEVTPQEKAESDQYFDTLDTTQRGAIEGEQAVGFFSQSGLPVDLLAKVWDLSDIGGKGSLDKDEFAVALKIIRDKLAGKNVPDSLPPSLIPPSKRQAAANAMPAGPQRDLLDLMGDDDATTTAPASQAPATSMPPLAPTSPVQRAISPQLTGQRTISPQTTGTPMMPLHQQPQRSLSPQLTGSARSPLSSLSQPQRASTLSSQATGSSTPVLGGTIFPQLTGSGSGTGTPRATSPPALSSGFANNFAPMPSMAAPAPASNANFFDDNDLEDKSQELANHQTQLRALQDEHKQADSTAKDATSRRTEVESSLASAKAEIEQLQLKLTTARSTFDTESKALAELESRRTALKTDHQQAQQELISAESDLSRVKLEKAEVESDILGAKEEIREIKKKVAELAKETAALREELDKSKKEQRHQKGLLAINKKQLNAVEAERASVQKELAEVGHEAHDDTSSNLAREIPLSTSPPVPQVTSPAGSTRSTNPFERMVSPQATVGANDHHFAKAAAAGAGVATVAMAAGTALHDDSRASAEEADPFGVPSTSTSGPSQLQPEGSQAASHNNKTFDEAFGDDFDATPAQTFEPAQAVQPTTVPGGFDDAFTEFDGNDGAVDAVPDDTAVGETAAIPSHDETDESSDDDEGPEDIEDASAARRPAQTSGNAGTSAPTGASDSGDSSYVHVAPHDPAEAREIDSKFPNIDAVPENTPVAALAQQHPPQDDTATEPTSGSEQNFEDATAVQLPVIPGAMPGSSTAFADSPASTAGTPAPHRRAAPPPPIRGPSGAEAHQPPAVPLSAPSGTFDDTFGDSFAALPSQTVDTPATAMSTQPSQQMVDDNTNELDDFESSFADMRAGGPAGSSAPTTATAAPSTGAAFESFDEDFDFKPDFADDAVPAASTTRTDAVTGFDDAFDNFDSSFDGNGNNAQQLSSTGFDDAFGGAPALPPREGALEQAQPGDVDGVKQIIGMGFTRKQAISALDKYDYDVTRAVNSLLGS